MVSPLIFLRDLPSDEALQRLLPQYRGKELKAIECYLLLLRAVNDMLHPVETLLAKKKLSRGRLSVLLRLHREYPMHVAASTLAHDCGVRQATMTGLLDGLVNARLARRKICQRDKRISHITITPKGVHLMERLLPDYFSILDSLSSGMRSHDRDVLIRMLRQFVDSVALLDQAKPDSHPSSQAARDEQPARGHSRRRSRK